VEMIVNVSLPSVLLWDWAHDNLPCLVNLALNVIVTQRLCKIKIKITFCSNIVVIKIVCI